MRADAAWSPLQWPGMEHAVLSSGSSRGPRLSGLALLVLGERPFRVAYRLACDAAWRARRLTVTVSGPGAAAAGRLDLLADGAGNWTDALRRRPVPELDGCVDLDLSVTPLTNTLPIRRLGLIPGMTRDLTVAYVKIPDLTVSAAAQRYTCISDDNGQARYRYESGRFQASLQVDEHGLVLDYPGIWRRIPLQEPCHADVTGATNDLSR
jgi:uncharacterized protein